MIKNSLNDTIEVTLVPIKMQLERKALYNLLRMNKSAEVQSKEDFWKVCDYRKKSNDELFAELKLLDVFLNEDSFLHYADDVASPEELTEILSEEDLSPQNQDHLYLILFELYRRLLPEKPSISILCDDLDEQIYLYDSQELKNDQPLLEALSNLQSILEEHLDLGEDPTVIFDSIRPYFANDLESFLYDFIVKKIDEEEYLYASEVLEGFYPFVKDKAWFDFLKARLVSLTDNEKATGLISSYLEEAEDIDPELNLEILQFLAHHGESGLFFGLIKKTLPLLETEDEFQDLLSITADYYHGTDDEQNERKILEILKKRQKRDLEESLKQTDPDVKSFFNSLEMNA